MNTKPTELVRPDGTKPGVRMCPLGYHRVAYLGPGSSLAIGVQAGPAIDVQVAQVVPQCVEDGCMFWRLVDVTMTPGPDGEIQERETYDCALVVGLLALHDQGGQ